MPLDLDEFPRLSLGHWPTPLEDAPRLGAALGGRRVLLKRDDVNTLGLGGNKLRKLEFLLAAALADGVDAVITVGALQTNHGRLTAAACAKLGLRCELVLAKLVPRTGVDYERSGNVALDRLFGAHVHVVADRAEAVATRERLATEAAAAGRRAVTIPLGGSNAVGTLGYVAGALELFYQLRERGITSARVVVAHGSGGTAAGVALAAASTAASTAALAGIRVAVACVFAPAARSREVVAGLVADTAALLGVAAPTLDHVSVDDRALGAGYGVPHAGVWDAVRLFASTEGVVLDPVYTGKAAEIGRAHV